MTKKASISNIAGESIPLMFGVLPRDNSLTVVHNFRVLVGFKESGVVPKILPGRCRQRPPGSIFHIKTNEKSTFLPPQCPRWCRVPWGPPGVLLGSSGGPAGAHLGSSWGPAGVLLGSRWGAPWCAWGPLGCSWGSRGVHLGIPWGPTRTQAQIQ